MKSIHSINNFVIFWYLIHSISIYIVTIFVWSDFDFPPAKQIRSPFQYHISLLRRADILLLVLELRVDFAGWNVGPGLVVEHLVKVQVAPVLLVAEHGEPDILAVVLQLHVHQLAALVWGLELPVVLKYTSVVKYLRVFDVLLPELQFAIEAVLFLYAPRLLVTLARQTFHWLLVIWDLALQVARVEAQVFEQDHMATVDVARSCYGRQEDLESVEVAYLVDDTGPSLLFRMVIGEHWAPKILLNVVHLKWLRQVLHIKEAYLIITIHAYVALYLWQSQSCAMSWLVLARGHPLQSLS